MDGFQFLLLNTVLNVLKKIARIAQDLKIINVSLVKPIFIY
jgi:uncharacterized protein YfkK (UPF0435 family)